VSLSNRLALSNPVTVTAQVRLLGSVSAVVSLRGIWECVGHQTSLDSNRHL
ncbi:hypothetical protein COCCADRAFT_111975, partial [Bipolaris zeicola 26-R-13]